MEEDIGLALFPQSRRGPPAIFLISTLAKARQTIVNTERGQDARGARKASYPLSWPYRIPDEKRVNPRWTIRLENRLRSPAKCHPWPLASFLNPSRSFCSLFLFLFLFRLVLLVFSVFAGGHGALVLRIPVRYDPRRLTIRVWNLLNSFVSS